MIDLHCHLLPGIDDGSRDLEMSLAMARMAIADGITTVACTPHIEPGVYDNTGPEIAAAIASLRETLAGAGLDLELVAGADVHMAPGLAPRLASGEVPSLGGSRYFLFEPPFDVAPPMIDRVVKDLVEAGYVPILTHPERLSWMESQYALVAKIAAAGGLVQLTAGSITGDFGRRPLYWSERMLDDGIVDLVATDAHNTTSRPPNLSRARDAIARRCGNPIAEQIFDIVPAAILDDLPFADRSAPIAPQSAGKGSASRGLRSLFGGRRE